MHLHRFQLTNFKNYGQQSLELSPRLNCFTGLTGMGKTNVLDAVHFICLCKSHGGLPDRNLVQDRILSVDIERTVGLLREKKMLD